MRALIFAGAIAWVLCAGPAAAADDNDREARVQFDQGVELYKEGKFEQAAIAFERAYQLKPSYRILFNVAQSENELGHYAAALVAYQRYLAGGKGQLSAERQAEVERELERLRALVGAVEVRCPVDGATVFIDDKRRGETPLAEPVFLDLGEHEVVLKHAGDEIHREVVRLAGGALVVVEAEIGTAAGAAPAAVEPAPTAEPAEAGAAENPRVWTWVAYGVGGAAAIAAAVTGGLATSKAGQLEDGCAGDQCPPGEWETLDSARRLALATNVLIGVAAVGVAAGTVLFFVEPGFGDTAEGVQVAPAVTDEAALIAVSGRF